MSCATEADIDRRSKCAVLKHWQSQWHTNLAEVIIRSPDFAAANESPNSDR